MDEYSLWDKYIRDLLRSYTGYPGYTVYTSTGTNPNNAADDERVMNEDQQQLPVKVSELELPTVIYEPKNDGYVGKWKDGSKEIVLRNNGEKNDPEKALLYLLLKRYVGLNRLLPWLNNILSPQEDKNDIAKRFNKWWKSDENVLPNDLRDFWINNIHVVSLGDYGVEIDPKVGIVCVHDYDRNKKISSKNGIYHKGFLKHVIYSIYTYNWTYTKNTEVPEEYYMIKKLTNSKYEKLFEKTEKLTYKTFTDKLFHKSFDDTDYDESEQSKDFSEEY